MMPSGVVAMRNCLIILSSITIGTPKCHEGALVISQYMSIYILLKKNYNISTNILIKKIILTRTTDDSVAGFLGITFAPSKAKMTISSCRTMVLTIFSKGSIPTVYNVS